MTHLTKHFPLASAVGLIITLSSARAIEPITPEQFKQIVSKVLIPDMQSRIKGFDSQIATAKENLSPKKTTGGKSLTKDQYEDIRKKGYTDDEIRAKGYEVPK